MLQDVSLKQIQRRGFTRQRYKSQLKAGNQHASALFSLPRLDYGISQQFSNPLSQQKRYSNAKLSLHPYLLEEAR